MDIGMVFSVLGLAAAYIGWEYFKMNTLKQEMAALKSSIEQLHNEHKQLIERRDADHTEVMRSLTSAINKMHGSIDDLTHYIRWLSKSQTGQEPAPPLGRPQ